MQQSNSKEHSQYAASALLPSEFDDAEKHFLDLTGKDIAFLLRATRTLNSSLDTETTLTTVARLSLPHLGSWCILDICEEDHMRRIAIIHPDPARQTLAADLISGWPPRREDPCGFPAVVQSGCTEVIFPVTDEMLIAAAGSSKNLELLRSLEIGSFMTVPLAAHGVVLGAITYISPNHGDSFAEHDKLLAEDLAARCATAIENSRLLEASEEARREARDAQARAEESNLAKMRFLSKMSHELRTPLNAIGGYASLLEDEIAGPLSEKQKEYTQRIHAAELHLLSLVETVLDYAKIDAGQSVFGLCDVSIAEVIAEVDGIIAPLAADKHITMTRHKDSDGDLTVFADPEKVTQVLLNLIGNAIKFTPDHGKVDITDEIVGELVAIRVSDTGVGIAPEHQRRIFEPFVQVEEGLDRAYAGTGLGLAISRELAVGMGGALSLTSEVGVGSVFTLTLAHGRG